MKYKIPSNLKINENFKITEEKVLNNMYDLLKEVDKLFIEYEIKYFIHYGTLLGQVRHGGFIPWDNDVDICVFEKDINKIKILKDKLNKDNNYKYELKKCDSGYVFLNKNIFKRETFIDIFIFSEKNKKLSLGYPYINNKPTFRTEKFWGEKSILDYKNIFPLKREKFLDFYVNVPNNKLDILFNEYSKNCLTECKTYDSNFILHKIGAKIRDGTNILEKILPDDIYIVLSKIFN